MSIARHIEAGDGGPVVVLEAAAPDAVSLRRRGERLRSAAHPGVVALLSSEPHGDGWCLRITHGGHPLSAIDHLDAERIATIAARVAETLADLHAVGVVHGRLTRARVLLGAHDQPALCGFGDEVPAGGGPAADVSALGTIVRELLARPTAGPGRGHGSIRRSLGHDASRRRALVSLANQACADAATRRPSMRRLAAGFADLAPRAARAPRRGIEPAGPDRPGPRTPPPARPLRSHLVVRLGGALVGVSIAGVLFTRSSSSSTSSRPSAAVVHAADEPSTTTTLASTPPCVVIGTGTTPSECPHSVVVDGTAITIDGARFDAGEPGDVVAVGSWRCDGGTSVAVFRPTTGEVFVFPAVADADVTVAASIRVPEAVRLNAIGATPGCHRLRVIDRRGRIVNIPVGSA